HRRRRDVWQVYLRRGLRSGEKLALGVFQSPLKREHSATLEANLVGSRNLPQRDFRDLETQVPVLMIQAQRHQIEIIALVERIDLRGRTQRVVGLLHPSAPGVSGRKQVVQLRLSMTSRQQLLAFADGGGVVLRFDARQR